MNPEEKALLKRAVELSQENNHILKNIQSAARWGRLWGFIKLLILITPFVLGYIYLLPYIEETIRNLNEAGNFVPILNSLPK
ncbi:MAG: hypothetical protein AAB690_00315 [Patescibacteria group bacterium]